MKKRLGEILLERGLVDHLQLAEALASQRQSGLRLGTVLVMRGLVAEGTLTQILAETVGIPMVDVAQVAIDPRALALVPAQTCETHDVLPLALKEQDNGRRVLLLAMADPLNATVIDEIGFTTNAVVRPAIAQISSIAQAIRRHYHHVDVVIAPLDFAPRARGTVPADDGAMLVTNLAGGDERRISPEDPDDAVLGLTEDIIAEAAARPALPDDYAGQRTGVFTMPPVAAELPRTTTPVVQGRSISAEDLTTVTAVELQRLELVERNFWALMRVLARRGVLTRDEFLAEVNRGG